MTSLSTPALVAFLLAYLIFCVMVMYFCVIADPSTSELAHFFQVKVPNKMWSGLGSVMNDKQMTSLQSLLDLGLVIVYFFVVLGCWTVVFWYIYPWIDQSSVVSKYHKYVGYLLFLACFGSWRLANTSSPGIITARSYKRFDHYPVDNLMFLPNQRCQTTKLIRIPRSKFDRLKYHQHVPRYDHFCGWVHNTIGEENYRWFLLFLLIHVVMCIYGSSVCALLFYGEVQEKKLLEITFFDRASGEHVRSNLFIVLQYLFARNTLEFAVLAIMSVMGIALGAFLGYHIYITSCNRTTNEDGKWTDITKWYKKEQKRYRDAVKKGLVKENSATFASPETPKVKDGDVSCTGGGAGLVKDAGNAGYVDPGPLPHNLYDRGFLENWKEVLFPISRRKEAVDMSGYSRPMRATPKADEPALSIASSLDKAD